MNKTVGIIILAAGKGTRMKSDRAKVLHCVDGRPMIMHVVDTASAVAGDDIVVVIGTQADQVKKTICNAGLSKIKFALQSEQKGTGHAAQCALPVLSPTCQHVVILSGDVPLIDPLTVTQLINNHRQHDNTVTILGVRLENPFGYGRIVVNGHGQVEKIVEETDASEPQKAINTVNSGIYCVNHHFLKSALSEIKSDNQQNEIYLTDIVGIARKYQKQIGLEMCPDRQQVMGINTVEDLKNVEAVLQMRR